MLALRLGAPAGDVGAPIEALPGRPVRLPLGADALESAAGARRSVTGDVMSAPDERGVWYVLRAGRRVGAVVVNAPPEESDLTQVAGTFARRASRRCACSTRWQRESVGR